MNSFHFHPQGYDLSNCVTKRIDRNLFNNTFNEVDFLFIFRLVLHNQKHFHPLCSLLLSTQCDCLAYNERLSNLQNQLDIVLRIVLHGQKRAKKALKPQLNG